MANIQHTTGPWEARQSSQTGNDPEWEIVAGGYYVAAVMGGMEGQTQANARLMAASPCIAADTCFLLDRLDEFERDLLDDDVGTQFHGHVAPAMARLRARIERAFGE